MPRKLEVKQKPPVEHFDHWNDTIAQSTGDFYAGRPASATRVFTEDDKLADSVVQPVPQK